MNLRSAAICLDCDEVIDLFESRKEEKCPRCGSKDHEMLSKYIKPIPVIRVVEKPVKKSGRKCKKAA
jgi:anaerobic ribonucleoside-triphosphate reductase